MKLLWKLWKLWSKEFRPLEVALLRELQSRLRADAADLLARQVEQIKEVRREAKGRELLCYSSGRGRDDPRLRFPADDLEVHFATITFSCPGSERSWAAKFYLVRGFLFSIVYDAPPGKIVWCDTPHIYQVQIHRDPMQKGTRVAHVPRLAVNPQLPSWVRQISGKLLQVYEPLNDEHRRQLLEQFAGKLPQDYIELMAHCDGLTVGDWTVLGLSEIYTVHLPEGDYYFLAQFNGRGALVVDPRDGLLYYFDDFKNGIPVGEKFSQALLTVSRPSSLD